MSATDYNTIYHCPLNELRAFAQQQPALFADYLITMPRSCRAAIVKLITR